MQPENIGKHAEGHVPNTLLKVLKHSDECT